MIKSPFFIIPVFVFIGCLHAQNGPVSSGGEGSGSGGTVSYSIGQIDYTAPIGSGGNINEGLQQPYEIFSFGVETNPQIELLLSIYPNPTTTSVFLKVDKADITNMFYELYTINGQQLASYLIIEKTTQIDLETYSPGNYILKITNGNTTLKSFKIIKK